MRSSLSAALTIVTCLVIVLATVAFGVQQTLLNTDRWVSVVGPLASDPTVESSVAQATAAMTLNAIDVQGRTQSLPAPLRGLAAPVESTLSTFVNDQTQQIVQSPQFAQLWVNANRAIHQSLVQLLRSGEPPNNSAVRVSDGQVEVNLLMLMPALRDQLQQGAPAAVLSQLSPDFGYVTIAQASTLATMQQAVQELDAVTLLLLLATPVLIVVTLVVSPNRRTTLVWLGVGVALGLLIAGGVLLLLEVAATGSLAGQPIAGAAEAAMAAIALSLGIGMLIVFVVAVAVALVAGLTGRRRLSPT
ncbi:MAG TPA: hypothetical protein VGK33_00815 [Chloroflexota bacterium]